MKTDQSGSRRVSAAVTAAVMMLLLLTWWARGAADAAQMTNAAAVFGPMPGAMSWAPSWLAHGAVHESGVIAFVGSGLIALGAFVRRTTSPDRRD